MNIIGQSLDHTLITWITADSEASVPYTVKEKNEEGKFKIKLKEGPADKCCVIFYKNKQYIREDAFLASYINANIRYRCSDIWGYLTSFGPKGCEFDNMKELAVEINLIHNSIRSEEHVMWLVNNPIDFDKIEKAIQKSLPLYQKTAPHEATSESLTYTYLSEEFIRHVFRPLIPNSPLVNYSQRLSNRSRFGALIGFCIIIPELFIRTLLNCIVPTVIRMHKKRDPIEGELQSVRYTVNQAAAIAVCNQCLIKMVLGM